MADELMTLPEVAELLRLGQRTIYSMTQKGELPGFKVGQQWRFKRADLDRWIKKQQRAASGKR